MISTDQPIVWLDTETTGLTPWDQIWEIGAIRRGPDGNEQVLHLFLEHEAERCRHLPERLLRDHQARFPHQDVVSQPAAATLIYRFLLTGTDHEASAADLDLARPVLVGVNPAFDAGHLERLLRDHGYDDSPWDYRLIDMPAVILGRLSAKGHHVTLPWSSDELSRAIGIDPSNYVRHTALEDARWTRAMYDALNTASETDTRAA